MPRSLPWVLLVFPVGNNWEPLVNSVEVQGTGTEAEIVDRLKDVMATPEYKAGRIQACMRPLMELDYAVDTAKRLT